ncbi:MAG TPA: cytochrome b N-terminal domain-containing protein [Nitrospiria bacterium]|jgi:ubiquinol-cytochrome c reductase cytochrome b subunit|nr:cytochrome b N-terminal domain-containing protein [Nitrospiria bacterium]
MSNGSLWNRLDQWTRLSRLSFPVPAHAKNLGYCLGGITLTGFSILFLTGLILAQFFNPQPDQANRSVHYIAEQVSGGRWLRSFHYWTAQAVILSMCAHLLRVFYSGSYKAPRILTWYFGTALFFTATMLSYFSGTVIKWDQEGSEALEHFQFVVGLLGPLGTLLGEGLTQSVSMNVRMYSFHVTLAPLLLIFLVVGHFYLIHVFNISPLPRGPHSKMPEVPKAELTGTFTEHLLGIVRFSLIFYGLVAILAAIVPASLGPAATSEATGVKPPWIYLWQYGVENFLGMAGILYSTLLLLLLFLIVPLLDRGLNRDPKDRKGVLALGALTGLVLLSLTLYGWLSPKQVHHGHGHGHGGNMEEMPGMEMNEAPSAGDSHPESVPPNEHHDDHHDEPPDHPSEQEAH